jgi:hypothetical protein
MLNIYCLVNTRLFGSKNVQQLALNVESNNNYQYKLSDFPMADYVIHQLFKNK